MNSLLILLVAFSILTSTDGCLSSGMCGGTPSCAPPPPPPVCARSGCGQGYSCGQYGCFQAARARMAGSKIVTYGKDDDLIMSNGQVDTQKVWQVSAMEADQQFFQCCLDNKLPDSCLDKCSYSGYTRDSIRNMFMRLDQCPLQAASVIHFCAAKGQNHLQCCGERGVHTTLAGPKCLVFCDQTPGNVTQLDFSYLPCYERFEEMKSCFYNNVFTSVMNSRYQKLARH
uniref:DB domain-containing protein n=1 Tax=Parastrongyloides trichosuri TaxID=131310 RepID=A0A0N4Z5U0_PARTI